MAPSKAPRPWEHQGASQHKGPAGGASLGKSMDGENMENRKLPGKRENVDFEAKKGGEGWMGGLDERPRQFGGIFGIHVTMFICYLPGCKW